MSEKIHIGLSIGGTKIAAGVLNAKGLVGSADDQPEPVTWQRLEQTYPKLSPFDRALAGIVDEIDAALKKFKIAPAALCGVGISWAGPGDYPAGKIKNDKIAGFQMMVDLKTPLKNLIAKKFSRDFPIEIMHDGAAGAVGEHRLPNGALHGQPNGMAVIIGTGVGAGFIENGHPVYGVPGKAEAFMGEIGFHLIRSSDGSYRYCGTGAGWDHPIPYDPNPAKGEVRLEQRVAGPWVAARFVEFLRAAGESDRERFGVEIPLGPDSLPSVQKPIVTDAALQAQVLIAITDWAIDRKHAAHVAARTFIQEVGLELGRALAVFRAEYAQQPFVREGKIVLISTMGERFGAGVVDGQGRDLFLEAIRRGAGFEKIVRSEIGVEREFAFAMP
jgi:hypothetical protein